MFLTKLSLQSILKAGPRLKRVGRNYVRMPDNVRKTELENATSQLTTAIFILSSRANTARYYFLHCVNEFEYLGRKSSEQCLNKKAQRQDRDQNPFQSVAWSESSSGLGSASTIWTPSLSMGVPLSRPGASADALRKPSST